MWKTRKKPDFTRDFFPQGSTENSIIFPQGGKPDFYIHSYPQKSFPHSTAPVEKFTGRN
jgi:hypothetical protein